MEEILKILESDARASYEAIATMTGLDAAEVERVVKEAQDSGVIVRHRTM